MLRSFNTTRTQPTLEPVTSAEVKRQLRIDHTEDDSDLDDMIAEVRRDAEEIRLDRLLIRQTIIDYFNTFDAEMELRWGRASSITSVVYTDANGDSQTLATSVYELGTRNGMGILRLKYGQSWPSARGHEDVIAVTYVAGYGTAASDVPLGIRRWIKARAAWMYENRDGEDVPWSVTMDSLLAPYATGRVHAGA